MMNKTVFDVEDIREIRRLRSLEYNNMTKDEACKLKNLRVEHELSEIARLRHIMRSVDECPDLPDKSKSQ